ncbi:hypothetical protein IHE44_0003244 [Lamprotornis superbus]|uniref:Uncharacterized protein n=1 Tax=Lamprotornis superbus TaxID=245042 RepID=A0A835NZ22_9PASS|nr:hypothetical protein IHE44_0003244 [Lamprotornis superbus]
MLSNMVCKELWSLLGPLDGNIGKDSNCPSPLCPCGPRRAQPSPRDPPHALLASPHLMPHPAESSSTKERRPCCSTDCSDTLSPPMGATTSSNTWDNAGKTESSALGRRAQLGARQGCLMALEQNSAVDAAPSEKEALQKEHPLGSGHCMEILVLLEILEQDKQDTGSPPSLLTFLENTKGFFV